MAGDRVLAGMNVNVWGVTHATQHRNGDHVSATTDSCRIRTCHSTSSSQSEASSDERPAGRRGVSGLRDPRELFDFGRSQRPLWASTGTKVPPTPTCTTSMPSS